jgi:hypothetical protein
MHVSKRSEKLSSHPCIMMLCSEFETELVRQSTVQEPLEPLMNQNHQKKQPIQKWFQIQQKLHRMD